MTTLRNRETDYQLQIHTKLPCEGYSNHLVNVLLKETTWTVEVGEMLQDKHRRIVHLSHKFGAR